jgi:hypothetical protein
MKDLILGVNGFKRVLLSTPPEEGDLFPTAIKDVTDDFYKCVVKVISEQREFKIDGMKFLATCKRIE